MPGLRYFGSLNNIIFGETILGYLIICTFIPFIFYKIFELLFSKKMGIFFTISFIFIPILENMGLGHFNFIWNFARFHAEPIAILLFFSSCPDTPSLFCNSSNISSEDRFFMDNATRL